MALLFSRIGWDAYRAALPSLWGRRGHLLCEQGGFTSVEWE